MLVSTVQLLVINADILETLREKVKSVDIRNELGVNSINEKVREIRLRWYEHM